MLYIKYFFHYIELPTKLASQFPFIIAFLYYINHLSEANGGIRWLNIIIFYLSMLCIDFAVTSISHYVALEKERVKSSDYENELTRMMSELKITNKTNRNINIFLVVIASILGLVLVYLSNIGVLLLGMLCFFVGIFYSFGPKPIAYTPFSEVVAGAIQGGVLPVIVIFTQYKHLPLELNPLLAIVFMPLVFLIANIMLANNICDQDKDIKNGRKTIVYFFGTKICVFGLYILNILTVLSIVLAVYLNFLNFDYLIMLVLIIPLFINTNKFKVKLSKSESFQYILKNFFIFSIIYTLLLIIRP
jgi:1,4-dihydroxy-2-naphthoate octaprenyltransferase